MQKNKSFFFACFASLFQDFFHVHAMLVAWLIGTGLSHVHHTGMPSLSCLSSDAFRGSSVRYRTDRRARFSMDTMINTKNDDEFFDADGTNRTTCVHERTKCNMASDLPLRVDLMFLSFRCATAEHVDVEFEHVYQGIS